VLSARNSLDYDLTLPAPSFLLVHCSDRGFHGYLIAAGLIER
jgi:hypothetical protein